MTTHSAVLLFLLSEAPPLHTCLDPFSPFSPLSFLIALTVVLHPYTFCLPSCDWVNWGRKWANAFNCQPHTPCSTCALQSPYTFTWNIKNMHVSNQRCVKCDCWSKGEVGAWREPKFSFKLPPLPQQIHHGELFFHWLHEFDIGYDQFLGWSMLR